MNSDRGVKSAGDVVLYSSIDATGYKNIAEFLFIQKIYNLTQ